MSSSVLPAGDNSVGVGITELIDQARADGNEPLGRLLQLYRNYLSILATAQLDARLRRRVSPSDLVQEALLGAYRITHRNSKDQQR